MRFTVVWLPAAQDRLAELWVDSSERHAVSLAANTIDRSLGQDPYAAGESRSGNERICIELPLAALYRVIEADMKVEILDVRTRRTRRT